MTCHHYSLTVSSYNQHSHLLLESMPLYIMLIDELSTAPQVSQEAMEETFYFSSEALDDSNDVKSVLNKDCSQSSQLKIEKLKGKYVKSQEDCDETDEETLERILIQKYMRFCKLEIMAIIEGSDQATGN